MWLLKVSMGPNDEASSEPNLFRAILLMPCLLLALLGLGLFSREVFLRSGYDPRWLPELIQMSNFAIAAGGGLTAGLWFRPLLRRRRWAPPTIPAEPGNGSAPEN